MARAFKEAGGGGAWRGPGALGVSGGGLGNEAGGGDGVRGAGLVPAERWCWGWMVASHHCF